MIGINCTKNEVAIANTTGDKVNFEITEINKFPFDLKNAKDCTDLYNNLMALVSAMVSSENRHVAILSCGAGTHGSSQEAIKAEAIVELICDSLSLGIYYVKPQSLKTALKCDQGERWQSKAKDMFNSAGKFKYFSKGSDGAVAAAYKAANA